MSHAAADRHAWTEPTVEDLGGSVHRIPLPLPIEGLKAVNVYAIADPGRSRPDRRRDRAGASPGAAHRGAAADRVELGDIRDFFVTHIHIDHYFLAVELRKTFRP